MQYTKRTRGNLRPFFCSRLVNHRGRSRQDPPDPGRGAYAPERPAGPIRGQTRANRPGPGAGCYVRRVTSHAPPGHVRRDRIGRTETATGRARSRNPTGTPPEPGNAARGRETAPGAIREPIREPGTATGRTRTHQERVRRTNPGKRTTNPRRASTGRFRPFTVDPLRSREPCARSATRPDPIGRTKPGRYTLRARSTSHRTHGPVRDAYGQF